MKALSARGLVRQVAERHFDERPHAIVERGGGLTNEVHEFRVSQGAFIVRSHRDATKITDYLKEQWAMDVARAAGVPTPRVLEVGNFPDGRPYMISERAEGGEGRLVGDRVAVLGELGRLAARLHRVPTRGYGHVFEWSSNRLSRHDSWADWLRHGFDVERRIGVLRSHRMISAAQASALRRTGHVIARWRMRAVLQHGDLRLKNVLVEPGGTKIVSLIDWDSCASARGPAWDLSIALHDLGIDEKEAFLAGYGLRAPALAAMLPALRFFNVLNYAQAVESAGGKRRESTLEQLRLRLAGAYDLYLR